MGLDQLAEKHADMHHEEGVDRWEVAVSVIVLRNKVHELLHAMADTRNVEQVGMTAAPIPEVTALWDALAHFDRVHEIDHDD